MTSSINNQLLFALMLGVIVVILVFIIYRFYLSVSIEKRFRPFLIDGDEIVGLSYTDVFISNINKIIKKISSFLGKSRFLTKYANHFIKYLAFDESHTIEPMDYISLKFIVMLFIDFLYFISIIFRIISFNFYNFIIISIVGFFLIDFFVLFIYTRRQNLTSEQLLEAVVIMNSAFKSGKNILGAIEIVKTELPNPIKSEFNIIYQDLKYGISVEAAFERFYKRINLEEAKLITSSLALLNKTGGNIVSVFNMIENNFYDRLKIKNELNALLATSKLLYYVLLIVPFVLVFLIVMLNPEFFKPLIYTKAGYVIDAILVVQYFLYIFIIKRVMKVDEV
ncbi:MAG: hypothetical protein GX951_04060 [Mollicutes bacterium]|nr:hypothetical protein [Mollicutes bacterium]